MRTEYAYYADGKEVSKCHFEKKFGKGDSFKKWFTLDKDGVYRAGIYEVRQLFE